MLICQLVVLFGGVLLGREALDISWVRILLELLPIRSIDRGNRLLQLSVGVLSGVVLGHHLFGPLADQFLHKPAVLGVHRLSSTPVVGWILLAHVHLRQV